MRLKELTTGSQTLIVADGAVNEKVLCCTNDMVSDISENILKITAEHRTALDVVKQQPEVLKQDLIDLLNKA